MASHDQDPTEPIRLKASRYAGVDQGTACTQSSFKTGKKAFLFIGMQGGRYKAMFKLQKSMAEAARLAKQEPDRFQVGSTAWVTARFTADQPMPKKLWEKWLDESYDLSRDANPAKKSQRKATPAKKAAGKQTEQKAPAKKRPAKKPIAKKSAAKKSTAKKSTAKKSKSKKKTTRQRPASPSKNRKTRS